MKITVTFQHHSYDIDFAPHTIQECGKWVSSLWKPRKIGLITDQHVYTLYGSSVIESLKKEGFEVIPVILPPGEKSKNLEEVQEIYQKLIESGLTRKDGLIALGGGVVGDITGFVASTYQRGISFLQIPTTLLAQIDSSIGGKTAVNLPAGKNLVGTFYQPDGVLIDPEVLHSLPKKVLQEGMAEAVKYGAIADATLFQKFESLLTLVDFFPKSIEIISRCCKIKKQVVEQDEKDHALRMILNFGHTIGHGIEQVAGYGNCSHGEAVAIGMYQMTCITEQDGYTLPGTATRLGRLLHRLGLPLTYSPWEPEKIAAAMKKDKKSSGDSIQMIRMKEIGKADIFSVPKTELNHYLKLINKGEFPL